MINRAAVILKCKKPFIKWMNETDPYEKDPGITLDEANKERTIYLIADDDAENFENWISLNYMQLFENELEAWYTDESLWPKRRDKKLFDEWFNAEYHSVLIDTVEGSIFDDEM